MRILVAHNRYQERGGEDNAFFGEVELLRGHGHEVIEFVVDNRDIPDRRSLADSASVAMRTIWSQEAAASVRREIRRHRPDIAHFHNLFPLMSPSVYDACQDEDVPVIQTLHNYRLICANALFFRNGHPCEDCLNRTPPLPAVVHRCYRDSRSESAVVVAMLTVHRARRTWKRKVNRYIALSQFSRSKFVEAGLPPELLCVKPNFVDPLPPVKSEFGDYFLFVGRLVGYKGVETMLAAWSDQARGLPLHIIGDGPLASSVEEAAANRDDITFLGRVSHDRVLEEMRGARALIFPSTLYENFPLSVVEALACGTPVIASRLGAMQEIVKERESGLLFSPADPRELGAKTRWAWGHGDAMVAMGSAGRRDAQRLYGADENYRQLMSIYSDVLGAKFKP